MNHEIVTSLFVALFAMVLIWFVFISWFFRRLRTRHASTYEAMGSPSLFWNNSMRNNWLFMKFVFSSKCHELDDSAVVNAVRFTRVFGIVYLLVFFGLMAGIGGVRKP